MNFEPGDIVVIVTHPIDCVVGRSAEVMSAHSADHCAHLQPPLPALLAPGETWYVLMDVSSTPRAAAHSWLRRIDPVALPILKLEASA